MRDGECDCEADCDNFAETDSLKIGLKTNIKTIGLCVE